MKNFFVNTLVVVLSLSLALCLGEFLLRILYKSPAAHVATGIHYESRNGYYTYRPGDTFQYENEPGEQIVIQADAFGLRNEQLNPAEVKIVVLGDSFISAVNTPNTDTLVAKLRQAGLQAYNGGMDGFSTYHAVHLLEGLLDQGMRPSTVVVAFYLGNDFHDNYLEAPAGLLPSQAGAQSGAPARSSKIVEFFKRTVTYSLVEKALQPFRANQDAQPTMQSYAVAELYSLQAQPNADMTVAVESTRLAFKSLYDSARKFSFEVLVVGIPSKAQVYESIKEISGYDADKAARTVALQVIKQPYSFDKPNAFCAALAKEFDFSYLNLLDVFRKNKDRKLFYQVDVHWTPLGQAVAAQAVVQALQP